MLWPMDEVKYVPEARKINDEFPAWDAWVSLIGGQWHARLKGSLPIVMMHDDSPAGLREQIVRYTKDFG
jgi:hypothetical protein